jgi:hypothetical protein
MVTCGDDAGTIQREMLGGEPRTADLERSSQQAWELQLA